MSLKNKIKIGKCPDECGRDIYSLGEYEGFMLTLKPFFTSDWVVGAKKINIDALDKTILVKHSHYLWSDTASIHVSSQAEALKIVKSAIDEFYVEKGKVMHDLAVKLSMSGKIDFKKDGKYRLIRNGLETDVYFTIEADETFEFVRVE